MKRNPFTRVLRASLGPSLGGAAGMKAAGKALRQVLASGGRSTSPASNGVVGAADLLKNLQALWPAGAESRPTGPVQPSPDIRPGPRFDVFEPAAQTLGPAAPSARLYVPPAAAAGLPLPLVVMLHGCTQSAEDFAAGTRMNAVARSAGFYVLYPEQSQKANPQRCWNWFRPGHQVRGAGEPASITDLVERMQLHHQVDAGRIYVAGLSAGGAMAALVAEAYPEIFAAVGVHSGLPRGAARDVVSALKVMNSGAPPATESGGSAGRNGAGKRVPTIVFHGDADATVHPDHAGHLVAAALGPDAGGVAASGETMTGRRHSGTADGGRRFTRVEHASHAGPDSPAQVESWTLHGGGHAWSGGSSAGSYTDSTGPDASTAMWRFFAAHPLADSYSASHPHPKAD